jgi:hypothetical protein
MLADAYYALRPAIPRFLQIAVRRQLVAWRLENFRKCWPIWEPAGAPPRGWSGWPNGKRLAIVLTHDVETAAGLRKCEALANIEEERGFRSAFGFVPLRYETPDELRQTLAGRGVEIMVHDAYHDGRLYRTRRMFETRRTRIAEALHRWGARGFSSGSMHHRLQWISELHVDYDISTYDVDPFEPQRCGLVRIFPMWVGPPGDSTSGFVELPYTLPQDFTLFVLMREQDSGTWRKKLDWIAEKGGMALIKTHPDYMDFSGDGDRTDSYPVQRYIEFLDYIKSRYASEAWFASPSEVAAFWRELRPVGHDDEPLTPPETLCKSCRMAHAEGWLRDYAQHLASASCVLEMQTDTRF